MRWVERVAAIHLARDHDPDGRLIGLQGTDLDGGRVGAQHDSVADIERILGIERRVVVGEVEGVEVVALRLRLGADRAREAKLVEDLADLVYDLGDQVQAAGPAGAARHGEILALGGARGALQRALARRQRGFELALQGVGRPADGLALLRLEGGERAQDMGERAGFPAGGGAVGVLRRPLAGPLGPLPQLAAPAEVALGELHHLFLALQARDVAFDAGHDRSPTPAAGASSAPRRRAPPAPLCAGAASAWGASSSGCDSCTPDGGATDPTRSAARASGAHAWT